MADNLHRQFDHIEDFETERPQTTNYQDYQGDKQLHIQSETIF